MLLFCCLFVSLVCSTFSSDVKQADAEALELIVFTVATDATDGFYRFNRSANVFNIDLRVIGMGKEWAGGDMRYFAGGGQKVALFREELMKLDLKPNAVVMFTDAYDVIFNAAPLEILKRFTKEYPQTRVLFSAEGYCWPDRSLTNEYPIVKSGKRYLNSGMFLGYAKDVLDIVSFKDILNSDDDQLYYTQIFLDKSLREKFGMTLDTTSKIFQNLNGAQDDVALRFEADEIVYVHNIAYNTRPVVIHGNGPTKLNLLGLGNYIAKSWTLEDGCLACLDDLNRLDKVADADLPTVVIAVFIEKATPFLDHFFERIANLEYPKNKIILSIHNSQDYHSGHVESFIEEFGKLYQNVEISSDRKIDERTARQNAIDLCLEKSCDYLFCVDSESQLSTKEVLKILIEQNRPVIGPLLTRPAKMWANFWGALSDDGFYARAFDYMDIVQYKKRGVWNVPYLVGAYLIRGDRLKLLEQPYSYNLNVDPDMSFAQYCRDMGYFMFVDNVAYFGHLIDSDSFETTHLYPQLRQLFDNRLDWEQDYLHENYSKVLDAGFKVNMPCPDVFYFPIFSKKFCVHLIEEMEHFGKWSNGKTEDPRLAGGYENVPTRDIHMNQVAFEREWLHILDAYFRPVQEKLYEGYFHVPATALMNFVVRYRPDEQPFLKPHHDSSTWTVNIALNTRGVDFEGGGARFIRYNCSVIGQEQGWALMHPGRLTHYHEGLPTTHGTRYIMVSFVNP